MPIYRVWPDGCEPDEATRIEAPTHEDAAEKWAEQEDQSTAEYAIVAGSEKTVTVFDPFGIVERYRVTGEKLPVYSAELIDEEEYDAI